MTTLAARKARIRATRRERQQRQLARRIHGSRRVWKTILVLAGLFFALGMYGAYQAFFLATR